MIMKRGLTSSNCIQRVFEAEVPEQYVRTLPAQALYLAIKRQGLESSKDIIDIATLEQCRLFLDFDLWEMDRFCEDNFWEWLSLADEEEGLKHLEKLLKFIDLRLIALIAAKYIRVEIFDDGNDTPPAPGFHTPDKGFTWIQVHSLDPTRIFHLNRFLALIFERDAELFYQLISIPQVSTVSMLEEETYLDRTKRLESEGVPEKEFATELTKGIPPYTVRDLLASNPVRKAVNDIPAVEPLLYDSAVVQPLGSLLSQVRELDEFGSELTLLMNASIVRWSVPFHEVDTVQFLSEKVKGAINIGIEAVVKLSDLPLRDLYEFLGLQKLFQFGLWHLYELRRFARNIPIKHLEPQSIDAESFSLIACTREDFPEMPLFFRPDGTIESRDGTIPTGSKAIEHLDEIETLRKYLEKTFDN